MTYAILHANLKNSLLVLFCLLASKYRETQALFPFRILVHFCQERLIKQVHRKNTVKKNFGLHPGGFQPVGSENCKRPRKIFFVKIIIAEFPDQKAVANRYDLLSYVKNVDLW